MKLRTHLYIAPILLIVLGCAGLGLDEEPKRSHSEPNPAQDIIDREMAEVEEAAERAAEDIRAAEDAPTCAEAYTQIKALINVARAIPGNKAAPKVPERGAFMEACRGLPPDVQECLLIDRLMGKPKQMEACQQKVEALPASQKARAQSFMEQAFGMGR